LAVQQGETPTREVEIPPPLVEEEENKALEIAPEPIDNLSSSEDAAIVAERPQPAEEEEQSEAQRSTEPALPVKIPESVALRNRQAIAATDEQQATGIVLNLQAFPMQVAEQSTDLSAKQLVQRF
jgi:hypothetical protein